MYEMELKPGSERNMLAMTGVITATTERLSLITLLQDMEYIHGQLFERSVESGCGSVTCLPGALTILRFSAFRKMAKYYFADKAEQCDDLFDYGKCHLGEDRWLTHLFMIGAKKRYQIQMCSSAFCKTEAVQTFRSLLKQRRRWFLGFITNEACMLTDGRLWRKYPLLCCLRFMQNTIRTTALLFFIMVISVITTSNKVQNLPVGFIAVSLGLNYLLMLYFGAKLRRYKTWLYPIMFILNPFLNWIYMVYGIFTAGQRTWGGPRADAGKADLNTSPEDAIKQAEAMGDELNVVPETFRPALAARLAISQATIPLQPSSEAEGRFAPAQKLPSGFYQGSNTSGLTLPWTYAGATGHILPRFRRGSSDSIGSQTSAKFFEEYMPLQVDNLFIGPLDLETRQRNYRPAQGYDAATYSDSHQRAEFPVNESTFSRNEISIMKVPENKPHPIMSKAEKPSTALYKTGEGSQSAMPRSRQKTSEGDTVHETSRDVYRATHMIDDHPPSSFRQRRSASSSSSKRSKLQKRRYSSDT